MNKVAITRQMLDAVKTPQELFDVPEIRDNWVSTYKLTSGKDDGEMRYEAEKILFITALSGSWSLQQCSKASLYSAWVELGVSGLTLRDGISYIVPYGKDAVFMPGWKGRLEQITEMQNVVHVQQPQVVYENDTYELILGEKPTIKDHKRGTKDGLKGKIVMVYVFIKMKHEVEFYYMERDEVLSIRDRYSQSYKQYLADCAQAKKQVGDTFKVTKSKKDGSTYQTTVEPPMWITDEAQAFKKTLVKRIYNELPKLPKHKWLDQKIKVLEEKVDVDDTATFDALAEVVDEGTGEVTQARQMPETPAQSAQPATQPQQPAAQTQAKQPVQNTNIEDAVIVTTEETDLSAMAGDTSTGF